MNDKPQQSELPEQVLKVSHESEEHSIATGLGTVGGGVAGASIGKSVVGGNVGAVVGSLAGAIAGGMAGRAIAKFTEEVLQETKTSLSLDLGADTKEPELPTHYSWEELQALSKPQSDGM